MLVAQYAALRCREHYRYLAHTQQRRVRRAAQLPATSGKLHEQPEGAVYGSKAS